MMKIKNKNKFKTSVSLEGRVCTSCGEYKLWNEFKTHTRSLTGHSSKCILCYKLKRKASGRKQELYSAKKRRDWLKKNEPILWKSRSIRSILRTRAKKDNMSFNISSKEIYNWLINQHPFRCYYSGIPLGDLEFHIDHKVPVIRGGDHSLDNLCISSRSMNTSKGSMTEKEFKSLLQLVSSWEDKGKKVLTRLKAGRF